MPPEITTPPVDTSVEVEADLEWQPPMPPTDLIFDDGEPLESNRHRIGMNLLIRSLKHHWADRNDFFVGGNMFIYYSSKQARNRDFRGPDFFVVLDVENNPNRLGWVLWEEEGRYPDMIVELLSDSTEEADLGEKKRLYERVFKTSDYFVFHPFRSESLQGWHWHSDRGYQPIDPNAQGWVWCQALGLWLGTWEGQVEDNTAIWLRFYDQAGNLVLLPEEAEKQRADSEQQRADSEQQRADSEQQRADRLAQRLRALGEDPDAI